MVTHVGEVDCDGLLLKELNLFDSDLLEECVLVLVFHSLLLLVTIFFTFCLVSSAYVAIVLLGIFVDEKGRLCLLQTVNPFTVIIVPTPLFDDCFERDSWLLLPLLLIAPYRPKTVPV